MDIEFHSQNDVTIVELAGALDSTTAGQAQATISKRLGPRERVVLNMTNVSYMSSAGIRTLLLLYRSVLEGGGKIVIVGLADPLRETLDITGFLEYFNVVETLDAGLQAVN